MLYVLVEGQLRSPQSEKVNRCIGTKWRFFVCFQEVGSKKEKNLQKVCEVLLRKYLSAPNLDFLPQKTQHLHFPEDLGNS